MTTARLALAVEVAPDRLPLPAADLAPLLQRAVAACGYRGALSVALLDDAAMRAVNRDFHDCDEPTDVLAFPLAGETGPAAAGCEAAEAFDAEVVVSVETAEREAAARGVTPLSELVLYVVHGTLHLLGYDDHAVDEARRMDERTLEVLEGLGLETRLDTPGREEPCADDAAE